LKSYDWAREQREKGATILCGSHSQIEKDVFEILLNGKQPLILALARGLMKIEAVDQNRLLVISRFLESESRVTTERAEKRNQQIIELADELMVGYSRKGGMLNSLIKDIPVNKTINYI
jgi:hypothetical protein